MSQVSRDNKINRPIDFVAQTYGRLAAVLLVPVTITIFLVVWAVNNLTPLYSDGGQGGQMLLVKDETSASSSGEKFGDSLLNALVIVAVIAVMTFLIVVLYKCGCAKILVGWFVITSILVFFGMLWVWIDLICTRYQIPYDYITISVLLWNFGTGGLVSVFYHGNKKIGQVYLVMLSVIMGWMLTRLPEWSTWTILVAVAVYDILAVLCPGGPLRLLVQAAQERKEPIPGFIYDSDANHARLVPEKRPDDAAKPLIAPAPEITLEPQTADEERATDDRGESGGAPKPAPKAKPSKPVEVSDSDEDDPDPFDDAQHAHPFKLGLGDFIFYSLLCGRAAFFSFISWTSCFTAVNVGLIGTLSSLLFLRGKVPALPALPISIFLGVIVFFVSRYAFTDFIYYCLSNGLTL